MLCQSFVQHGALLLQFHLHGMEGCRYWVYCQWGFHAAAKTFSPSHWQAPLLQAHKRVTIRVMMAAMNL
jgi:hypothetical protein